MIQNLTDAAQRLLDCHHGAMPGGFSATALDAVEFFWTDKPSPREPLRYTPGLAIILSGTKIGYLDGHRFEYGAGRYLAVGLPVIFECETRASRDAPLVGVFIRFQPAELREFHALLSADRETCLPRDTTLGVEPLTISAPMQDALIRLLDQLCKPQEAAALGAGTVRELLYHALQDRHGRVLLSLTQLSRPEARIADLLHRIEQRDERVETVEVLAKEAGMSPASLHRHFKGVTGYSPLQYLKRQRLMRARQMLIGGDLSVTQTSYRVGYVSSAQFSRDFRRLFGYPPSQARQK